MRCNHSLRPALASLIAASVLAGCGLTPDDGPTVEYRDAESTKSLEVPPDLTRPESSGSISVGASGSSGAMTASIGGATGTSAVLPEFDGVRFVRAGASSWLEVDDVPPDSVWPRVDRFLRAQGLTIARSEPALGIVETGWAERFDGPESGGLTGFFNNVLGGLTSDTIRDRYNIRLERMQGGGTRIFVAHHSAQEVDTQSDTPKEADFEWVRRRGDPSIEAEMARRLLVYLGVSEPRSGTIVANATDPLEGGVRYELEDGVARVIVDDPNPRRVFARVGDALPRIGAQVRSAQDGRGVYVIDWRPPRGSVDEGGFLGLFGDDEPSERRLELQLFREPGAMRIKAANEGSEPRSGDVHRALLRELAVAMGADAALVSDTEAGDGEDTDSSSGRYNAPDGPQF